MKYPFPNQNKTYLQNNRTNIFPIGNLWSTFSIDLETNLGALRIFPRMRLVDSSITNIDQMGCPVAFRWFDTLIWAICDTRILHNTGEPDDTPWTDDASTGFEQDYSADESDFEIFNGTLCSTTTDALMSKAANGTGGGTWTARDTLNSSSQHVMTYFKKFDRLYYANQSDNVLSIDTSWVTADPGADYAISLSPGSTVEYTITSLKASPDYIWIGTLNLLSNGEPGKLCQWDGLSAQITDEFRSYNSEGIMAIAIDPETNVPYTMDTNGVLCYWTGSGLKEVARLPVPYGRNMYNIADTDAERFIHANGMYFTKNGNLRLNINNRSAVSSTDVIENMPSGIWEWKRGTNSLVHISPFTYNPIDSTTITDYGQNRIARTGALTSMNVPSTSNVDGTMLAGALFYTNATTSEAGIFTDNSKDTIQKKGYFVTDWFESNEIADSFDVWWASFRKFLSATDNIVFKYRIQEEVPVSGTITWVDTTHFTVANTVCDVSQYWTSDTGGEVEILRGTGGGSCVHITDAVLAGGTWTVTVDEVVTGVTTGTATARFQKWIKVFPAEALSSVSTWAQWAIGTDSTPRIQIKGCFTFTGAGEFYKGILTSNEDIKS